MKAPPRRATVHAAAKINVGWHVGPRRHDGYHDVCGLLQSISLTDRLVISTDPVDSAGGVVIDVGDVGIRLRVVGADSLETENNLVCRATELIADQAKALPTTIELTKRIPVAAGLGGGSADAAAALVGLNTVWGAKLSASRLVELGAEIGSDVPAMLVGGLVHASGRGEKARRVGSFTEGWIVVGVGAERVSAAASYAELDRIGIDRSAALHHNDLEQAAIEIVPALRERIEAMRDAARVAFVSGSGPAVIGVLDTKDRAEAVRERVAVLFEEVHVVHPIDWGVRLVLGPSGHEAGQ